MKNFPLMFAHSGKTNKIIGKKRISTYKRLYEHMSNLQDNGTVKVHENYLDENDFTKGIEWILEDTNYEGIFKNCLKIVDDKFGNNLISKKYVQLYNSIKNNQC